jgi:NAD(P)-dependent dehydrogenase (short-subunit alcohol dehydrogenase family)
MFTRYLALELGARGIAATVVAPGAIATALGRVGQPDDVGGVTAFLCSDEAKWSNDQCLEVAGGVNL